jgi:hypothetical protein
MAQLASPRRLPLFDAPFAERGSSGVMTYTVTLTEHGFSISAPTASEAVRKAKALAALGKQVVITDAEGEPIDLRSLELVVRKKKLP